MRLASLFSGGKDSVFSMYLAVQSGFEVPYIVSINPVGGSSWIFHVPNIDKVPAMAEAMGREHVEGTTDGTEEGDLEGLMNALSGLDIDGVVMGAVWSDYQMDRVNRICGELGLKVFAPLWRKDQEMMIREIVDSGIKVEIIGYYAEGFGPEWLGRTIDQDTIADLEDLNKRYSISVMGEGGEYETFVTDSPLHKYPLLITDSKKTVGRNSGTLEITRVQQGSREQTF
ncbi:MAG TPA: diphthine--ammonia ligase [Candidatus Methanomethylophilaceae archaeon]|nr:diphthine--ammonia ligase [Candidatus Methanomethylophilaceae archaeon]